MVSGLGHLSGPPDLRLKPCEGSYRTLHGGWLRVNADRRAKGRGCFRQRGRLGVLSLVCCGGYSPECLSFLSNTRINSGAQRYR